MRRGAKHSSYAFDQFRLDADTMMLYRDGTPVKLPSGAVKLLVTLVEKRDSIVSKEDLTGDGDPKKLSRHLSLLRKALGTKPDGTSYIETIRKQGYRFRSDNVTTEPDDAAQAPALAVGDVHAGNRIDIDPYKSGSEAAEIAPSNETARPANANTFSEKGDRTKKLVLAGAAAVAVLVAIGFFLWFKTTRSQDVVEDPPAVIERVALSEGALVADATISFDGRYITYHEIDGEDARIFVRQTGQGDPIEIALYAHASVGPKTFSPDGEFIYYLAREGDANYSSIYRVPTRGGVPTKVVENALSYVSLSPDGKSLAYVTSDPVYSLVVVESDGTGEKILTTAEPSALFAPNPAWSPDGKSIVFGNESMSPSGGKCTISSFDLEAMKLRAVSSDLWDSCSRIEWRRDGKGIVFIGTKAGDANTTRRDQVYYMNVANGTWRRLTTDPSRKQPDSLGVTEHGDVLAVPFTRTSQLWVTDARGSFKTASRLTSGSADGRAGVVPLRDGRVAFIARSGENTGISVVDADGGNRRELLAGLPVLEGLTATPDGKYLFFSQEKENGKQLFRVDSDGANLKQITHGEGYRTDSSASPDGKWLVFDSTTTQAGGDRIWRVSTEGGEPIQISDQLCKAPRYSPSGKSIVCVWSEEIFVISAMDGRVARSFRGVHTPLLSIGAKWARDEKGLVYVSSQRGTTNLWLQPLDGKPPSQLTDFVDGDIYNFAYSHDGSKLYLARGYQVRDAILIKNFQ